MVRHNVSRFCANSLLAASVAMVGSTGVSPIASAQTRGAILQTQASRLALTTLLQDDPKAPQVPTPGQIPDPTEKVPTLDLYRDFLAKLIDLIDEKAKKPDGSKSQRETAFEMLAAIDFAMYGGLIALPVGTGLAGAGVGAVIGTIVGAVGGAPVADGGGATILLGMGIGSAAGGAIGTGVGIVLSVAGMVAATVISVALMVYINDHYPPDKTASAGSEVRVASSGNFGFAAPAGPYESLVIHMVDAVFNDKINQLADLWDRMPGLTPQQKAAVAAASLSRPFIQQISYIVRNKRISPNSPVAQPLSGWMKESVLLLGADSEAVARLWLNAMGLGSTSAKVKNGKLTLDLPAALTAVGAPETISADMDGFNVKAGGEGGAFDPYFKVSINPGPFDLTAGSASLVESGSNANRIKLTYSAKKGSTLGNATFKWKWNGPEASLSAFAPSLSNSLTLNIFLKPDGLGLAFDKLEVGGVSISTNLPGGLPNNLPGLSDLLNALGNGIEDKFKEMLSKQAPYMSTFNTLKAHQAASLKREITPSANSKGMFSVSGVEALRIEGGKLRANARGQVFDSAKMPSFAVTPAKVAASFNARPLIRRAITIPIIPALPPLKTGGQ